MKPSAKIRTSHTAMALLAIGLLAGACAQRDEPAPAAAAPAAGAGSGTHEQHAHAASHDTHATPIAAPVPPEGARWPTDEPLRAAMLRIRDATDRVAPSYDAKEVQAADAAALAATVEQDIAYMVANCRLEPEPDAALHALIGRMMAAAAALRKDPLSAAGVPQLQAVMHEYSTTFDHPGWAAPAHAD